MIHGKAARGQFKRWVQSSNYDAVTESLNNSKKYLEENPHIKYPWENYLMSFTYKYGRTILSIALETVDWRMFELLLNFGFDPKVKQVSGPNLLLDYVYRRGNDIYREPVELLLDRGVQPFYRRKDRENPASARMNGREHNLFPSCVLIRKFPDLFERFDLDETYLQYPHQMLLTGACGNNLSYVRKSLEILAQKKEDFNWLYRSHIVSYLYEIKDEEILDVILDHIPCNDINNIVNNVIFYLSPRNIPFLRVLLRRGYDLNSKNEDGYHMIDILIRGMMSYMEIYERVPPSLETCDNVHWVHHDDIKQMIALGIDVSLNHIPVQGELKDLLQRDVVSLHTLALQSCNRIGVKLTSLPRVLTLG